MDSLPFNEKKGCPSGFHKRSAYTSKRGHRVGPRCVKAQTVYNESRKNYSRRVLRKHPISKTKELECPPGKIARHGYVRRFGATVMKRGYTVKQKSGRQYHVNPTRKTIYVKPMCIKDRGNPNVKPPVPGKEIGPLRKGELKKHGYIYEKNLNERHHALRKAVKEFGTLGVYRKLDAIAKLSRYSVPRASKVFREDREWLKHKYGLSLP